MEKTRLTHNKGLETPSMRMVYVEKLFGRGAPTNPSYNGFAETYKDPSENAIKFAGVSNEIDARLLNNAIVAVLRAEYKGYRIRRISKDEMEVLRAQLRRN
jgi:hypothetical protein